MKLSKKLLPILAIVPTVATLSTSLTACSKNKKRSWAEVKKIALANFDNVCFAAVKINNWELVDAVDAIKKDLIKLINKNKDEDIINLISEVAYDIANIDVNYVDKISDMQSEWIDVKNMCSKLIDLNDGEERVKLALKVCVDTYQKLLNNINYLPEIKELSIIAINELYDPDRNLESCKAISALVQAAFANENAFGTSDNIYKLVEQTSMFWVEFQQPLLDIETADYVFHVLSEFLTNIDYSVEDIVKRNLDITKESINFILELLKTEAHDNARLIEDVAVAFISKSAWKTTDAVNRCNTEIYHWFLDFIKALVHENQPVWVLKDMCSSVFGNLLNNSVTDINNLSAAIRKQIEQWIVKIIEEYYKFYESGSGDKVAKAFCQFLSAEFEMGKDVLFASGSDFTELDKKILDESIKIIENWIKTGTLFAEQMTEFAKFNGKFQFALTKLKGQDKLIEIINIYRSNFEQYLKDAAAAYNSDIIKGCSQTFEYGIETVLNHSSVDTQLLLYVQTDLMANDIIPQVKTFASAHNFLSNELIGFANGLFKSINEIPNDCFDAASLETMRTLATGCFTYINEVLEKDGELASGLKLSEFILGNFFTSAVLNAGKNVKFVGEQGWISYWLHKYTSNISSFIDKQEFDFAAEMSRVYDAVVKVMRFGVNHNFSQLSMIVDKAMKLSEYFNPNITCAFDVYVNAILSLDHDYSYLLSSIPYDMQEAKLNLTNNVAKLGNVTQLQVLSDMSSIFAEEKYSVSVNPDIKISFIDIYNANLNKIAEVSAGNFAANATLFASWYKNIYNVESEEQLNWTNKRYQSELKYILSR